ncbi:unnamed protein product [Cuscuta epithymum]|uniref:Retrotransposon Copia-like N-terminal domain-containing protein n=1 Tax=Cuscuta epithymum TaxID=186058 RepID=A0AAV0DCI5_9ASTE|nr:unnamed protein product [Cuscuta epithymum]
MAVGDENTSSSSKIDFTSPFYLGPQDRPGDFITPVRLTGENYDDWSSSVRLALRARRKFVFVNGVINEPVPPCTEEDWLTIHSMLVSWIMNVISPEVKLTLSKFDDAKLLWNDLKERFSVIDGPKIYQVKTDIARCEQSKTQSVATYYGKLKVLWDELNNYEPLISCSCGKCTCKVNALHEQRRESERFHQFLMGLSTDFYGQIRSQLLSQTPLPTLNRAFQQITQEERVRDIMQSKERDENHEVMGFALRMDVPNPRRYEKIDKSGLHCTHCNLRGHTNASCFEIVGYPEWWGTRPRLNERNTKNQKMIRRGDGNSMPGIPRYTPSQKQTQTHVLAAAAPGPVQSAVSAISTSPYQLAGQTFQYTENIAAAHQFPVGVVPCEDGPTSSKIRPPSAPQTHSMAVDTSGRLSFNPAASTSGFSNDQWQTLVAAFGQPTAHGNQMHGPSNEEADWNG